MKSNGNDNYKFNSANKKRVLVSIVAFALATVLTLGCAYAWFAVNKTPRGDIDMSVVDLDTGTGNIIDLNTTAGQESTPTHLYPNEAVSQSISLANSTDGWLKIKLVVERMGVKYGELPTDMTLANTWKTVEGQPTQKYADETLTLDDFVSPVSNATKLALCCGQGNPTQTDLDGFETLSQASVATTAQKTSNAYNFVTANTNSVNVFCGSTQQFADDTILYAYIDDGQTYAYITEEADTSYIYVKNGATLNLNIMFFYDAFKYVTIQHTQDAETFFVTEYSSNPFVNQNLQIVFGAQAEAVVVDSPPVPLP